MTPISIVVPVGPQKEYKLYLDECIDSIREQMIDGDQIIIIDDQAHLESRHYPEGGPSFWVETDPEQIKGGDLVIWRTPWLVGCADAWNFGISFSRNDLVLMMGSDDRLLDGCLDALREAYEKNNEKPAWYNLTILITEGPDAGKHSVFNNAAAVTKSLWGLLGGFPPSAGVGAPDALLISIMMVHMSEKLIQVREGHPLYFCRVHPAQETGRQHGVFFGEVLTIRDRETARWEKPTWT